MNRLSGDAVRTDTPRSPAAARLTRRAVLPGLAAFLLAGCASAPKKPQAAGMRTSSSTKPAGSGRNTASAAAGANNMAAGAPTYGRKDSQPKTAEEFIAQQPARQPF